MSYKSTFASILFLFSSLAYSQYLSTDIYCKRQIICGDGQACTAKVTYWMGAVQQYHSIFYTNHPSQLLFNSKDGMITFKNGDEVGVFGVVDIKDFPTCAETNSDSREIYIEEAEDNLYLRFETEESICSPNWDDSDWKTQKTVKYHIYVRGIEEPALSSNTEIIECNQ